MSTDVPSWTVEPKIDYAFLEKAYFAAMAMACELQHVELGVAEAMEIDGVQVQTLKTDANGKFITRNPAKEFLEKYGSPVTRAPGGIDYIETTITVDGSLFTQDEGLDRIENGNKTTNSETAEEEA